MRPELPRAEAPRADTSHAEASRSRRARPGNAHPGKVVVRNIVSGDAVPEHVFALRVYYEDTDAGGMVYHASYLRFAERARTEMMRGLGFEHRALDRTDGLAIAVKAMAIDFRAPARLDDLIEVRTRVLRAAGAAIEARQCVTRGAELLATLDVRLACIDRAGRPRRLPAGLDAALRTLTPSPTAEHAHGSD